MQNPIDRNHVVTRRRWLGTTAGAAAGLVLSRFSLSGSTTEPALISVEEQSDFDEPVEKLTFNLSQVEAPLKITSKGPKKDARTFAEKMLAISKEYATAGICRSNAQAQISQFLQLFGLPFQESGVPVRYCATGVCFAACRAYCEISPQLSYSKDDPVGVFSSVLTDINHYYFKPNPAVRYMKDDAVKRGSWIDRQNAVPKPGWLIVFSFRKDGVPSHIGIVEAAHDKTIQTVEFNTTRQIAGSQSNGGCVAQKGRDVSRGGILGYIKTY